MGVASLKFKVIWLHRKCCRQLVKLHYSFDASCFFGLSEGMFRLCGQTESDKAAQCSDFENRHCISGWFLPRNYWHGFLTQVTGTEHEEQVFRKKPWVHNHKLGQLDENGNEKEQKHELLVSALNWRRKKKKKGSFHACLQIKNNFLHISSNGL